jgi:hypothetical protein
LGLARIFTESKDRTSITTKLQKERSSVRGDYNAAVREVGAMKVSVRRKDEHFKSLTTEATEQSVFVDSLHMEIVALKKREGKTTIEFDQVVQLKQE